MKKSGLLVIGIVLVAIAPLVVLTNTVYTLMLPNIYESNGLIAVQAMGAQGVCDAPCPHCSLESSSFLKTQVEMIQTKPILYEVIKRLNLQSEWGWGGELLPRRVARKILQNSLSVHRYRDTSLIEISVKRDNPDEAALIANELAAVYRDSRRALQENGAADSVEMIDLAEPSRHPISPNLFLNVLLSVGVALVMAVVGVVLIVTATRRRA